MNKIKFWIITLGVSALAGLIDRLQVPPLKKYLDFLLAELQKVVEALTDSEPNNDWQLKAIWQKEHKAFFSNTIDTTIAFLPNVKDAKLRYVTAALLREIQIAYITGIVQEGTFLNEIYKDALYVPTESAKPE